MPPAKLPSDLATTSSFEKFPTFNSAPEGIFPSGPTLAAVALTDDDSVGGEAALADFEAIFTLSSRVNLIPASVVRVVPD